MLNPLLNDHSLRKRFVKDFSLPIQIIQSPYYEYFIELYDSAYQTKEKENLFSSILDTVKNKDEFFKLAEKTANNVTDILKSSNAYLKLQNSDPNLEFPLTKEIPKQNIYHQDNLNIPFVSIDIKKANFQAFNLLGFGKELNINSYEDLIKLADGHEYFQKSKYIRQVIFGNPELLPKKQQRLQKYMIQQVAMALDGYNIITGSEDELIIQTDASAKTIEEKLKTHINKIEHLRVTNFSLEQIGNKNFFVRTNINANNEVSKDFKMVPNYLMPQAYKQYYNMEINENDKLFYYEGYLAKFEQPAFELNIKKKIKP